MSPQHMKNICQCCRNARRMADLDFCLNCWEDTPSVLKRKYLSARDFAERMRLVDEIADYLDAEGML